MTVHGTETDHFLACNLDVLDSVRDVRAHTQVYIQQQVRRIHEVVADLLTFSQCSR